MFEGTYVGTDPGGTSAVPNLDGLVESGTGDPIGGTPTGARNVFSGNTRSGVDMGGAVNDVIEGNRIGVNSQDTARLTNGSFGILVSGGSGDTIGGTAPGAGNVIGGVSGTALRSTTPAPPRARTASRSRATSSAPTRPARLTSATPSASCWRGMPSHRAWPKPEAPEGGNVLRGRFRLQCRGSCCLRGRFRLQCRGSCCLRGRFRLRCCRIPPVTREGKVPEDFRGD